MALHQERAAAVRQLIDQARELEKAGVTYQTLDRIGGLLAGLARRTDLFPPGEFPIGADGGIYRLSEDPDHRFTLYASAGGPGKKVPPHNHTTWAIIAGVHGAERNVVYDRLDNRDSADVVQLRENPAREKTLRTGDVIAYLPDDFHHIETPAGAGNALHLHFYGLSLEHLPGRVMVDPSGKAKRFMSKAKILTPVLSVQQVKAMLKSDEIFAFFDVREEGEFSIKGHPLFATPLPLSRLEPRAFALLPDPATRVVLMDSGEEGQMGRANRAAAKLSQMGYNNVAVVNGGLKAWADAGYEVFTGVNVPSKAFGEVVEHDNDTPRIDAADVQKLIDSKADMVILDSRPMPEFNNMSIPTGIDCPGAELVYRVKDFAPRPETLVVVNCAGRTRSIIGAQSLINAGLPNKVMALKNGTMGWHLAGLKVARGETKSFGPQGAEAARFAQAAAADIAKRMKIRKIDMAGLKKLEGAQQTEGGRPLYRLDVRDPAEYAKGHIKGFRHAAGGQLVQATDQYVGARNATIVLHDNDGVRATMTAHWLLQMNWNETYILDHAPSAAELTTEAEPRFPAGFAMPAPASVTPAELDKSLKQTLVVDLDTSLKYRDGHVPGAWFAVRANLARTLPEMLKQQAGVTRLVLVSPDGEIAALAAAEAAELSNGLPVAILAGGMKAWRDARLAVETGHVRMADPPTDVWYRPYDFKEDVEAAMRQYLDWEVDLVPQVKRDGDASFAVLKPEKRA